MIEKQTDAIPHRVLKEAKCPSLSGNATLIYQIGCDNEKSLHIRIKGNSGGGLFNREYVPFKDLLDVISDQEAPFKSSVLKQLFVGKSNNTQFFILAALLAEGLITQVENKYVAADPKGFQTQMKALMSKKPSAKETT